MRIDSASANTPTAAEHAGTFAGEVGRTTEVRRTTGAESGERGRDSTDQHGEGLEEHVKDLNELLRFFDRKLAFEVHEATNRYLVKVVDVETEEVLREIPPERVLDIVARIEEMVGLVIDERI